MIKETWIIHVIAMALGAFTLRGLEWFSRSAPLPWAATGLLPSPHALRRSILIDDAFRVAAICLAVVLFFFSGCLLDPSGLGGLLQAFAQWTRTGMGETGHEKSPLYWWDLLARYEWPALLGAVSSLAVVRPHTGRFFRWLAIGAGGALAAYSIVAYKTPWCLIAWAWPFFLVFGAGVEWVGRWVDRAVAGGLAAVLLLISLAQCVQLNFERYADENEPYVYVQTTNDLRKLLDPLRWQRARDSASVFRAGHIIQPEHHPMLWLFGDRPNVTWDDETGDPDEMDADWLLVDASASDRIEERLSQSYYRSPVQIRGMSPDQSVLYLNAAAFGEYFPNRDPEFQPDVRRMQIELDGGKLPTREDAP